jgi:hypothetical protein
MNKKVHLKFRVRTSAARYTSWALSAPVVEFRVGLCVAGELQDHFVDVTLNMHIQWTVMCFLKPTDAHQVLLSQMPQVLQTGAHVHNPPLSARAALETCQHVPLSHQA